MKGAFQITRLFGIPLKIHWSFGLILIWLLFSGQSGEGGFNWRAITWSGFSILALFACVVLHELGHALTARRYGVATRDIILLPIGGLAILDRLPTKPIQEFWVALAGPVVNIALAILFSPLLLTIAPEKRLQLLDIILHPGANTFLIGLTYLDFFFFGLVGLNLLLAVFNLLPAFPMDGGRILRALLSIRYKRLKATQVASLIGQVLAVGLIILGLWEFNLITIIIGGFIFLTAANEYRVVKIDSILEKATVKEIIRTQFTKIYLSDSIFQVSEQLKHGLEQNFLVFDEWHNLLGAITKNKVGEKVKKEDLQGQSINNLIKPALPFLTMSDSLKKVLYDMRESGHRILPVIELKRGNIIGVVDDQGLDNYLKMQRKK